MASLSSLTLIKDEEIAKLLSYEDLLPVIEKILQRYSCKCNTGDIIQPVRTSFLVPKHNSMLFAMPCYIGTEDVFCTKVLTVNQNNVDAGLPTHCSMILLFNGKTGQPQALVDGDTITAMRTAAASAIATKYLVNGTPKVLAILGAGGQARSHCRALCQLYTFSEIKIWNIRKPSGMKFYEELKGCNLCISWHNTVESAVKDADIICVVTSTHTPILEAKWVKPGAHINAIAANHPTYQELDPKLMLDGVVYVDCIDAAHRESGDIIKSGAKIYAEIGEVIGGQKEALQEKTTIFKSAGLAIEDAAAANIVYQKLLKKI